MELYVYNTSTQHTHGQRDPSHLYSGAVTDFGLLRSAATPPAFARRAWDRVDLPAPALTVASCRVRKSKKLGVRVTVNRTDNSSWAAGRKVIKADKKGLPWKDIIMHGQTDRQTDRHMDGLKQEVTRDRQVER